MNRKDIDRARAEVATPLVQAKEILDLAAHIVSRAPIVAVAALPPLLPPLSRAELEAAGEEDEDDEDEDEDDDQ